MEGLNITICGCGNGAHACAALMSRQGHEVTIFSPLKEEIREFRENYQENQGLDAVIVGKEERGLAISRITDDPEEALKEADLVFVTVPAFAHETVLGCLKRHVNRSALIAVMPCRGMIELEFDHFWNEVHMIALVLQEREDGRQSQCQGNQGEDSGGFLSFGAFQSVFQAAGRAAGYED